MTDTTDPFVNPYHFVPIARQGRRHGRLVWNREKLLERPELRHDLYADGTNSGHLRVKVELMTPTFVGNPAPRQDSSKDVPHYTVPRNGGEPALPGTSLRGMVSAVHEALTNSSLRVAMDSPLSHRQPRKEALPAIGRIVSVKVKRGDEIKDELWLWPLKAPARPGRGPAWRNAFGEQVPSQGGDNVQRRMQSPLRAGHLLSKTDALVPEGDHDALEGQVALLQEQGPESLRGTAPRLLEVSEFAKRHFATLSRECFTRGPLTPKSDEKQQADADEGDLWLPFHPLGTRTKDEREAGALELRDGDLVWFDVGMDGESSAPVVTRVAFSSVWRRLPEKPDGQPAGMFDFLAALDEDYTPLRARRANLSPSELLFGFVSSDKLPKGDERPVAWAGRVAFTDALLLESKGPSDGWYLEGGPWKELASPKPPSPALYFGMRPNEGKLVNPAGNLDDLSPLSLSKVSPRGRKFYLNHDPSSLSWESERKTATDRQRRAKPLRSGLVFEFQIHFDNLTGEELGGLLVALEPGKALWERSSATNGGTQSTKPVWHRLGQGKPLGLGGIRLSVEELAMVNRRDRYTPDGLSKTRFSDSIDESANLRKEASELIPREDLEAVCDLLRSPPPSHEPVHYPICKGVPLGTEQAEEKLFQWHVANKRTPVKMGGKQVLRAPWTSLDRLEPSK